MKSLSCEISGRVTRPFRRKADVSRRSTSHIQARWIVVPELLSATAKVRHEPLRSLLCPSDATLKLSPRAHRHIADTVNNHVAHAHGSPLHAEQGVRLVVVTESEESFHAR